MAKRKEMIKIVSLYKKRKINREQIITNYGLSRAVVNAWIWKCGVPIWDKITKEIPEGKKKKVLYLYRTNHKYKEICEKTGLKYQTVVNLCRRENKRDSTKYYDLKTDLKSIYWGKYILEL